MIDRIEIVRSDPETDKAQPWHARLRVNGKITFRTENYARKVGAERASLGLAKMFGWEPELVAVQLPAVGVAGVVRDLGLRGAVQVVYLDERST